MELDVGKTQWKSKVSEETIQHVMPKAYKQDNAPVGSDLYFLIRQAPSLYLDTQTTHHPRNQHVPPLMVFQDNAHDGASPDQEHVSHESNNS
ncbi:hypothetical protein [Nitrospira sp. M1]